MARYKVKIGTEFDLECTNADELDKIVKIAEEATGNKTRRMLSIIIVVAFLIALAVAGAIGIYDGSYDELNTVWTIGSATITGHAATLLFI